MTVEVSGISSLGSIVEITAAVDVSVVGVVVIVTFVSDAISSLVVSSTISEGSRVVEGKVSVEASVVVSSIAISEGFRVVEGKVSVEAIDTSSTVDISVTISDGTVVDSIVSVDVSVVIVVISGNMRDSEGKVVVIISGVVSVVSFVVASDDIMVVGESAGSLSVVTGGAVEVIVESLVS